MDHPSSLARSNISISDISNTNISPTDIFVKKKPPGFFLEAEILSS